MNGRSKGYIQKISGIYKIERTIFGTGINRIPLKRAGIKGSFVNGIRESILFSFALNKPPAHKIYRTPGIKLLRKVKESVSFHITFYFRG